ncbi:ejaculatory bulb-specific protein 3-like [Melitaea cinxia]|uniref:ejaculatory bulb-specific protein 3-like n=1 Tax=Melitaea cinxia TaxID=113334 RepID=UPI0006453831|nr:ejaculatory bulb-specific protein 3-like [Melitaea cinxia]
MRLLLLLSLTVTVSFSSRVSFENLDIDRLLSNEGQRKAAFACLMDKGPCGEMQALKDIIPHLIKTRCGDCNSKQKQKYDYVLKVLFEKYPEKFNALVLKYSLKAL